MESGLTADELDVLMKVIDEYLSDLRTEIHDTDNHEYKRGLKLKEGTLREVLAKLEKARVASLN